MESTLLVIIILTWIMICISNICKPMKNPGETTFSLMNKMYKARKKKRKQSKEDKKGGK